MTGAIVETTRWDFPIARRHESRTSRYDPDGKPARTWVFPVRAKEISNADGTSFPAGHYTLAVLRITSGRTHQIRVHAATAEAAVAGDTKYGAPSLRGGMILHAWMLTAHGHDSPAADLLGHSSVEAPLPADATSRIRAAFGGDDNHQGTRARQEHRRRAGARRVIPLPRACPDQQFTNHALAPYTSVL